MWFTQMGLSSMPSKLLTYGFGLGRGDVVLPDSLLGFSIAVVPSPFATLSCFRVYKRNGTPLETHNVVRQVLKPLCKGLGIMPGGMHAFRHGRVSHLQTNNVPADFTKSQVGHSSLRTTSGYTHFPENFARETVERLARKMASGTHLGKLDSVETAAN